MKRIFCLLLLVLPLVATAAPMTMTMLSSW